MIDLSQALSPTAHPTRKAADPPAAGERVLLELDPRELVENPLNPREHLGDLAEMADSMRECGVLEPLIVTPTDADPPRHTVVFGHRRRAAAIEAGLATVPCAVRPEYAGRSAEQLADMLVENLHRRDLTVVEEAGGYAQLAMFDGWTPERIAGRLGRPVQRVRAGVAAARVAPLLRQHVAGGEVTLEQAVAIEEFAGDEKAYQRLVKAADYPPGLHYALADERDKRSVVERKAATRAELRDANVRIVAKPKDFPWSSVEVRIADLTDPDGAYLTAETHAGCPGSAAFVDDRGEPVFLCLHPKDWGHGTPPDYRHLSQAEGKKAEEAAAALREHQQALAVADEARASFLTEYLGRKGRAPAGTLRAALELLCRSDSRHGSVEKAGQLLQPTQATDSGAAVRAAFLEAVARTAENRLPYLALALAAAAGEDNLLARGASWRFDPAFALQWLAVIESLGYPPSDAETQLRDDCQRRVDELAPDETDELEDEGLQDPDDGALESGSRAETG